MFLPRSRWATRVVPPLVLIAQLGCSETTSPPSIVLLSVQDVAVVTQSTSYMRVEYSVTNYAGTPILLPRCGDYPNAGYEKQMGASWASYGFVCGPGVITDPFSLRDGGTTTGVVQIPDTEPGEYRVTLVYWTSDPRGLTTIASPSFHVD